MDQKPKNSVILLAEDDEDDFLLTQKAFKESRILNELRRVKDGEELMDYLLHRNAYSDPENSPAPVLILMDLNMPRKSGREAIREIKSNPNLKKIPVIALTTSQAQEDVDLVYDLGVNSFIRKPVSFDQLVKVVKILEQYWFEIVRLPQ